MSNHGGRQVDGAIGALDALPPSLRRRSARWRRPVRRRHPRRAPTCVKALALGAQAVLIGRPYAYGLGLGGEDGVRHVLRTLRNDFELTMRLSGHARLDELGPDAVQRRPGGA